MIGLPHTDFLSRDSEEVIYEEIHVHSPADGLPSGEQLQSLMFSALLKSRLISPLNIRLSHQYTEPSGKTCEATRVQVVVPKEKPSLKRKARR